jgi:flagellar hook-length control protein FliK
MLNTFVLNSPRDIDFSKPSDNQHKFEQRDKTEQKPVEKSTNYISNFDKTTEPEPSKVSTLNQLNSQVKFESELTKETLKPSANIHIARISELPQKISSFVESINQFPARAEITLSPKSLGMVIVDITVVNNEVKVMFKTETKEAQQILESQIGTLKDKLASLGFDKQNFEFVNHSEGNLLSGFANYRNEGRNEEENLRRQFLRSFANLRTKNENYFENIWRENDFQHQSSERQW